MVEILKQGQYKPMHVADQVLVIFAGTRGYLDKVPVNEVPQWEEKFLTFMCDQKPEIRNELMKRNDLDDALIEKIKRAIVEFQTQYDRGETAPSAAPARKPREPVAV